MINKLKSKPTYTYNSGFTLIEILIVVVIIAGVFAIFAPNFFTKSDRELRSEIRRMSLLARDVRNRALITKNTHRIVFNIQKDSVTFVVEEAQGRVLLDDPDDRLKFINSKKNFTDAELEAYMKSNPFKPVERFSKKGPLKLAPELTIKQIELQGIKEQFKSGEIQIYFMPEGFVELAVIQVQTRDEALKWTLVTSPLTGLMDVFEGHINMQAVEDRE